MVLLTVVPRENRSRNPVASFLTIALKTKIDPPILPLLFSTAASSAMAAATLRSRLVALQPLRISSQQEPHYPGG